jgi:transposase
MDEQPTLPPELRASLPAPVQAYLSFIEAQIELLQQQVATLQAGMAKLQGQVADAQARVRGHSGNSSRPPSSDPPDAPPRPKRPASGRKRGGQPGHVGHARLALTADKIAAIVEHRPDQCPSCTLPLDPTTPPEGEAVVRQVWEIPPLVPQVTEHRGDSVRCSHCDVLVPAADLPEGAFGPRLTAIGSLLHGRYRLSMRETARLLDDLFGVPLAVGSIPALCQEVSAALSEPYDAVRERVTAESHANVDETGWKQAGERRWLWVAVTALCSLFVVAANRSAAVLLTLLGEGFDGVVSSDRYRAYLALPVERRQICWAHLKRNLQAFAERSGPVGDWGKDGIARVEDLFAAWHRFRHEGGDRPRLQAEIAPIRAKVRGLLERGQTVPSWQVRAFSADTLKLEEALWTFTQVDGVEPTNNAAEQALRPAVLWRKGCFGADSTTGNAFVERILTIAATCRQQQRHLLSYLTTAVEAQRIGHSAPPLLAPR